MAPYFAPRMNIKSPPPSDASVEDTVQYLKELDSALHQLVADAHMSVQETANLVDAHAARKDNPHAVTAAQAGAVGNAGSTPSIQAGLDANKPAAGTVGRLYIATDTHILYRDDGTAWVKIANLVLVPADIGAETPAGAQAKVDAHANRTDNPHAVTAAQVGAVSKAGDTMTGPLGFRIGSANPRYHQHVAAYEWSTNSAVGAFVIETPISATEYVMMRLLIEGYFYDSTSPFLLIVGGYIYGSGPAFYNYGYINLGKKRPLVRWGRNIATGKVVLIIGDVGDTYSYPKLWVSLLEGHNPNDAHRTGWTIAQKTDLTGYDLLTTVPDVGAFWHAGNLPVPIPVTSLKKATGSWSSSGSGTFIITVNRYAFASPLAYYASVAGGVVSGIGYADTTTNACKWRVSVPTLGVYYLTWDYLTASGHPRIWAIVDDAGNIVAMWEAEDPADEEFPDECSIGLTDDKGNSIIPVGGAAVQLQFPSEQQLVVLKEVLAKAPMPSFASRGIWVKHKTPHEIVQTIFDREMQSRGLEPLPDVREALSVQDVDKRNWRIQLWLRALSRVRKDHRAFTLIPLFKEAFRVNKVTGAIEFK